ncbi:ribonuclease P protein component [Patescibacteria group bacterium]|nr:ribonuclease P protein component [Patescibacteria group bacterium]MBU2259358.1 ribonuclease P protein component [Patescibacteria group bacterium]
MKLQRLSGRKICERVMKQGKMWKGKTMTIRWISGPPRHPNIDPAVRAVYAGTFASAKLHKSAVKRNRMRRRCREALRTEVKERDILPAIQLLLAPRSSSLSCDFADIQADVRSFLSHVS